MGQMLWDYSSLEPYLFELINYTLTVLLVCCAGRITYGCGVSRFWPIRICLLI